MPTILSHPAFPLAVGIGLGRERVPRLLLLAGVALSILPDLDVIGFHLGVPYAADFGHRGFSHAIPVALLTALLVAWTLRRQVPFWRGWWFLTLAMASHGLLDCLTTGGKGVALLWPFFSTRLFAPIQVIQVAPLTASRMLSARGLVVLESELLWVWLPCAGLCLALLLVRRCWPSRSLQR